MRLKRYQVVLAAIGVVVLCISVAIVAFMFRGEALPKGGRARVLTVTHGTRHRVAFPMYPWTRNLEQLPRQRSLRGLGGTLFSRPHGGAAAQTVKPSLVVWFLISDRKTALGYEAELITSDGKRFPTKGFNSSTSDGYFCSGMQFPVIPYDERMLRLEVNFEGKPCVFTIQNPAYVSPDG